MMVQHEGEDDGVGSELGSQNSGHGQELAQNNSDNDSPSKKLGNRAQLARKPNWPI